MPNFLQTLQPIHNLTANPSSALDILNNLVADLNQFANGKFIASLISGYLVDYGQEWKVVLQRSFSGVPIDYVLLRAYVPATNYPVRLDLYENQSSLWVINDDLEMNNKLTEFLGQSEIQQMLANLYGPTNSP